MVCPFCAIRNVSVDKHKTIEMKTWVYESQIVTHYGG
jgi:hypothetical protein